MKEQSSRLTKVAGAGIAAVRRRVGSRSHRGNRLRQRRQQHQRTRTAPCSDSIRPHREQLSTAQAKASDERRDTGAERPVAGESVQSQISSVSTNVQSQASSVQTQVQSVQSQVQSQTQSNGGSSAGGY